MESEISLIASDNLGLLSHDTTTLTILKALENLVGKEKMLITILFSFSRNRSANTFSTRKSVRH